MAKAPQLAAVVIAFVFVVGAGGYGLVRGLRDDTSASSDVAAECTGSVAGLLMLGYGDRGPVPGQWVQISDMPGDYAGNEKLVRTDQAGYFRVDGVPLGLHHGYIRYARFDFTLTRCGDVLDVSRVEFPLIHPALSPGSYGKPTPSPVP